MQTCLLCHRENLYQPTLWQLLNFQTVSQSPVCTGCWQTFEPIPADQACQGCGRRSAEKKCPDCQKWQADSSFSNRALYTYNAPLKRYMSQYKFNGDYRLRRVFQGQFQQAVKTLQADLIVPIPINQSTRKQRGFNQVLGFLEGVETLAGLATVQSDKSVPQSAKTRQQRLLTAQPFKLNVDEEVFRKKRVLLVDDIYTTGRTIRHAAELLIGAGAREVIGLTLAHG
ncbi:ComF family protein [Secundilactobacillus folii]|uniref:ComF family protein n=1 Tax=Secundilactobacillus folii TaxID=2678357 RepID=A0A7X2XY04_9LACO|nr:ComF family protein [Secundilactobacillus folii]MTV82416.1 ComF family protein [Secundilactobacillus folii]